MDSPKAWSQSPPRAKKDKRQWEEEEEILRLTISDLQVLTVAPIAIRPAPLPPLIGCPLPMWGALSERRDLRNVNDTQQYSGVRLHRHPNPGPWGSEGAR